MMISRGQLQQVIQAYFEKSGDVRSKAPAAGAAPQQRRDAVEVSGQAREAGSLAETISGLPDIRTELVGRLKAEIQEGRYQVDPEAVAEKIMERLIVDSAQQPEER
ncbi:MAG: flagellar biosynthesis anti-sigma factor FlgM [Thermaerobacterales bacterium]